MCEFDQHGKLPGVAGFVDEVVTAMVNTRIYSQEHPRVRDSVDDLEARLAEHFAGGAADFTLTVADGYLIFDQRPLRGASMSAARLIQAMEGLGSGGFQFTSGAGRTDLSALLHLLSDRSCDVADQDTANRALQSFGGLHVRLMPPYGVAAQHELGAGGLDGEADQAGSVRVAAAPELALPVKLYQGVVDTMQAVTIDICRGDQFCLDHARGQIEQVLHKLDQDPKSVMTLSRYEHYDAFTFGHSIRVSFLAMVFARELTDDAQAIQRIGLAGLMHDVGKARVPFEILQSRSRLTDEQRRAMEGHTVHGGELLLELADTDPWAVSTAFGHHRTMDGGGYPKTLPGSRLSTVTRLIKICDVFEALTAERPYKAGMSPVRAYRIMMSMCHFDPAMLRMFIRTIGIYPTGTQVELSDGRAATVESQNEDLRFPVVTVETTPEGDILDPVDQEVVDLAQRPDRDISVARALRSLAAMARAG